MCQVVKHHSGGGRFPVPFSTHKQFPRKKQNSHAASGLHAISPHLLSQSLKKQNKQKQSLKQHGVLLLIQVRINSQVVCKSLKFTHKSKTPQVSL